MGDNFKQITSNAVLHVRKIKKQGVYDFKCYFNVSCIAPTSIDDMTKSHHLMGPEKFDKLSHSYGRILVVPENANQTLIRTLPQAFE